MSQTFFDEIERRVLGVLIEKALSQPDYYPMTVNAIVTACNQKSNRQPMMDLDEEEVSGTLEDLRGAGLVTMVLPAPGARMHRYKQELERKLGWNKRQQAIMAELLLRGPQTSGELRSRCARLFAFENLEAITTALDSLSQGESEPPVVAIQPRGPGQSTVRYTHLLYPADEVPETAPASAAPPSTVSALAPTPTTPPPPSDAVAEALRDEIDNLHGELADLHEELAEMRQRLDAVENKTASL